MLGLGSEFGVRVRVRIRSLSYNDYNHGVIDRIEDDGQATFWI